MTTTPLSLDNAMQLASEAFLPCGCVTSANPEDDSFGFTVMNGSGEELARVAQVRDYADPLRMAQVIEQTRQELIDKGCTLEPWTMPFITDASAIPAPATPSCASKGCAWSGRGLSCRPSGRGSSVAPRSAPLPRACCRCTSKASARTRPSRRSSPRQSTLGTSSASAKMTSATL